MHREGVNMQPDEFRRRQRTGNIPQLGQWETVQVGSRESRRNDNEKDILKLQV